MTTTNDGQALLRAPRAEIDALRGWADFYRRPLAEELRLAVRLLLAQHMLGYLQRPEGRADVEAQGLDPDAEARAVKARLRAMTREAFTPPPPPSAPVGAQAPKEAAEA